jgi:uncharacterized protein (TIGR04255 family)
MRHLPFIGAELSYVDAFPLENGQPPYQFLREKFDVTLLPPEDFLSAPFVEREPSSASLSFEFEINEPKGALSFSLGLGEALGSTGYFMDTRVRSLREAIEFSHDGFDAWMEAAHEIHQHAFRTLIKPAFMKSFE